MISFRSKARFVTCTIRFIREAPFAESLPFLFGNIDPSPIPLFVDNLAALSVTNHPNSGAKSRHVALREFRIRDHHEANKIRPYWCPGPLNVADFFSKTLQKNLFNINLKRLGMVGSFRDEVEVRALTAYNHSDWVNAPSAKSWRLYHVFHGQIDFGGAETAYYSSETM